MVAYYKHRAQYLAAASLWAAVFGMAESEWEWSSLCRAERDLTTGGREYRLASGAVDV